MKAFLKALAYIWQLPQNLVALVLLAYYNDARKKDLSDDAGISLYITDKMPSGVSLGNYIILNSTYSEDIDSLNHELGHCIQSRLLGWLYLPLIGLPSLLGNIYDRLFHKDWEYSRAVKWYYNQPWEKWADELGGVRR